jgi:hypothetical protein
MDLAAIRGAIRGASRKRSLVIRLPIMSALYRPLSGGPAIGEPRRLHPRKSGA